MAQFLGALLPAAAGAATAAAPAIASAAIPAIAGLAGAGAGAAGAAGAGAAGAGASLANTATPALMAGGEMGNIAKHFAGAPGGLDAGASTVASKMPAGIQDTLAQGTQPFGGGPKQYASLEGPSLADVGGPQRGTPGWDRGSASNMGGDASQLTAGGEVDIQGTIGEGGPIDGGLNGFQGELDRIANKYSTLEPGGGDLGVSFSAESKPGLMEGFSDFMRSKKGMALLGSGLGKLATGEKYSKKSSQAPAPARSAATPAYLDMLIGKLGSPPQHQPGPARYF